MKTSEPNNTAPPSPDESGDAGGLLSFMPLRSPLPTLLALLHRGTSPGSQKQPIQPQVHSSPRPPGLEWPARETLARQRIITDIAKQVFALFNISISFEDEWLARRMIAMADVAYSQKRHEELQALGQLLESTRRYQFIGAYYRGLAALKSGCGDLNEAQRFFNTASEFAPAQYRARAVLSLGAVEGYKGNVSKEFQHYAKTLRIEQADYYTQIETRRAVALISALDGKHQRAVEQLEALYTVVRDFRRINPRLYFDTLNSLAVEYSECGRVEAAEAAIRPALNSPLAERVTEYRQTAAEIAERRSSKVSVVVAMPTDAADDLEARPRTLIFSEPLTPTRLRTAPPSLIPAHLLGCAPIRGPTTRNGIGSLIQIMI